MPMRKKLIAGNWKMHGSLNFNETLLKELGESVVASEHAEVLVCLPNPYLFQAKQLLTGSSVVWGAQNVSEHDPGAYTGEVSSGMLRDFGCKYVIVGHSERRRLYAESDAQVAKKFVAAQRAGLIPIICIGETTLENERGVVQSSIDRQLDAVLAVAPLSELGHCVISYEPLWAIGTGKVASPEVVQAVHGYIRAKLAFFDRAAGQTTRILYGGSVNSANAAGLLAMPDVDGLLVGGASLHAEEFVKICHLAI